MIISGSTDRTCPEFTDEIDTEGFAIFSRKKAKGDYYLTDFPEYKKIRLKDIREGDVYTIRAFFPKPGTEGLQIESGVMIVKVEFVDKEIVWACILTQLPEEFPLQKGTTIELSADELLELQSRGGDD